MILRGTNHFNTSKGACFWNETKTRMPKESGQSSPLLSAVNWASIPCLAGLLTSPQRPKDNSYGADGVLWGQFLTLFSLIILSWGWWLTLHGTWVTGHTHCLLSPSTTPSWYLSCILPKQISKLYLFSFKFKEPPSSVNQYLGYIH